MSKYSPEFLTKMISEPMTLAFINRAISLRLILEAKVISYNADKELILNLGKNIIGKIPYNEIEYNIWDKEIKESAATSKVSKYIKFIPKQVNQTDNGYEVICSRKDAQEECYNNYISKLIPGDIIDAKVVSIKKYGVFCDIGCGITALLHTNNISVTHMVDIDETMKGIYRLRVVVKEIQEDGRIQLSHKELLGTWEQESSKIHINDIITGVVLSKEEYGTFIRISQNLSGLADNSDIDVNTGDIVLVRVTDIKPLNMKIKLVIINKVTPEDEHEKQIKFNYYYDIGHMSSWKYSTDTAKKQIESNFD